MNRSDCRTESLFVAPLQCFSKSNLEQAGGKGANLGELLRAGYPVPPGFVITTKAYERVASKLLKNEVIASLNKNQDNGASIRGFFENVQIPQEIIDDIVEGYNQLGQGPVAVRSSATAEDLPEAAFAGQQDTFLNIIGVESLIDSVRQCWASLWNDRAIAYRNRQGVDQQSAKLAVIVQRLVPAEAAGVMFTANPVTGARKEVVIDYSQGLGEAVVSGLVTPEHIILQKHWLGWRITSRQTGHHEIIIRPRPEGGTEKFQGDIALETAGLPDSVLRELTRLGKSIQNHFNKPQDIEWAWSSGKLHILQTRPITALPEPPPRTNKPLQMLTGMFAEMFPIRPYPLDQTTWIPAVSQAAVDPIFSLIGIEGPSMRQLLEEKDGVVTRFNTNFSFHVKPSILLAPFQLLWTVLRYDPLQWRTDPLRLEAIKRASELELYDLRKLSWEGLIALVKEALSLALPIAGEIRRRYYPRAVLSAALLRVALGLIGQSGKFGQLLSGTDSTTTEANDALEHLAAQIRSDKSLLDIFTSQPSEELVEELEKEPSGRKFLADLRGFNDQYGHREVVLSTVLEPTWKDEPKIVLGLLQGLALSDKNRKNGIHSWEAAWEELESHPLFRFSVIRSAFLALIATARCLWQIRESTHYDATPILPILRRTFLELGHHLVDTEILDIPEDIFHLKLNELESINGTWPPPPDLSEKLRSNVEHRKQLRAALGEKPLIDPRMYRQGEASGEVLLIGMAGSPGIAQGPVRVIHNASEFSNLRSGEVLVAPFTNPAWTPLFQRAVAVVVDGGSAGSHAAIVAREYGLPAVMATVMGTRKLRDGEWVQVDGNRGMVLPASKPKNKLTSFNKMETS